MKSRLSILELNITADHLGKHVRLSIELKYFPSILKALCFLHVDDWVVLLLGGGEGGELECKNSAFNDIHVCLFSCFLCFFFRFVGLFFLYPFQVGFSHSTAVNAVLLSNFHFYLEYL